MTLRIIETALAIGAVIFVHELGHFLVARWCGVLVERFSIGFGPVLFSIRRGDTEYALSAIPLGGYVKMLGQTDTPGIDPRTDDERSYQNKSVGQRMAIISAGVIMNIFFGFFCFAAAYHIGVRYSPAVIGTVVPGEPAWVAGLEPGDDIVAINGKYPTDYEMLVYEVVLTNPGSSVDLLVRRGETERDFAIVPAQEALRPQIGVYPEIGLQLPGEFPVLPGTPAERANDPGFRPRDKVLAVDGEPVETYTRLAEILDSKRGQPVTITVRRHDEASKPGETADIVVEPAFFKTLGLQMQIGEIIAIQSGSPAQKAVDADGNPVEILAGDVIKAVDGVENLDPVRIGEIIGQRAGQSVELTLLRKARALTELKVYVVPDAIGAWSDFPPFPLADKEYPMSIPSVGLAYRIAPRVVRVEEGSPAATAANPLRPNDVISHIELEFVTVPGRTEKISIDVNENHWPAIFWSMQFPLARPIKLTVEREGASEPLVVELEPRADAERPFPLRGMFFIGLAADRKIDNVLSACHAGLERTRSSIKRLYATLMGLIYYRTLSPKNLMGPIGIATIAYETSERFSELLFFLGLLSINLAVINFLPIPVLDGGHMVFLLYELVMRRPMSERAVVIANYGGLLLILALMLFVIVQDFLSFS